MLEKTTMHDKWFTTEKDPQVDSWPLMSSSVPMLAICGAYLLFVLKIGPKFMEHRKPFDLRSMIITYNGLQVIFSLLLSVYITGVRFDYSFFFVTEGCHTKKTPEMVLNISIGAWWYLIAKFLELFDTIFFVLRKKSNQITKLHVFHHTTSILITWYYLKYMPAEQGMVTAFHNDVVHIFMYGYYLIAALGPEYRKYLWWKKYITVLQLIQFALNVVYYSTLLIMDCDPPKFLSLVLLIHCGLMFILFSNFYFNSYKPKTN